jgi:hypothetical protein
MGAKFIPQPAPFALKGLTVLPIGAMTEIIIAGNVTLTVSWGADKRSPPNSGPNGKKTKDWPEKNNDNVI